MPFHLPCSFLEVESPALQLFSGQVQQDEAKFLVFTVARLVFLHYVSVGDVAPFIIPVSLFPTTGSFVQ